MKKLFFASFLAIVAVGGAYATNYSTGPNSTGTKFSCTVGSAPICSEKITPTQVIYTLGTSSATTLPLSEYNYHYATL